MRFILCRVLAVTDQGAEELARLAELELPITAEVEDRFTEFRYAWINLELVKSIIPSDEEKPLRISFVDGSTAALDYTMDEFRDLLDRQHALRLAL